MCAELIAGKVLLVSQDAEAGRLWAGFIRCNGLEVVVTSDYGLLHRWDEYGFDLFVVDAQDHGDGLELCGRLRAHTLNPILLLAARCDDPACVEAYRAGVDECIEKPVSPAVLVAKVRAWLRHAWTVLGEDLIPPCTSGGSEG